MSRFTITKYQVMFYGGRDGYQDCRAQITLHTDTAVAGFVKFHDPGRPLPNDSSEGDKITMHLSMLIFGHVLDVLRNEKPITFYIMRDNAFLTTEAETVGAGDR